ncbi:uncharacterized protein [Bemisia tabaci]|uniref:uncharacterized protein isoform X3 n=1 Tax=Bemisia tabaci TaxID=7038 RepID=UPI003B27E561
MLPILPLDVFIPAAVLARRGGICADLLDYSFELNIKRGSEGVDLEAVDAQQVTIRLIEDNSPEMRRGKISDSNWALIEALESACPCSRTGRFLTMHKRRRKRLTSRSLSQDHPALLDDIHHGSVQCVLDKVWQWPFNAFTLDNVTGGRSLPVLCVHLFHWYGLLDHFNLDVVEVWKLFSLIEEGYHSTNPYHNSIHATDVTQAMHCFLQEEKIREHLTPLEVMAALIAAVAHDLDHPGVNQPFLIATSNHLAALYENTSVLENHHWRSAIGCLLESSVADQLSKDSRKLLDEQISSLILATDITRQQEFLTRFKDSLDKNSLDMKDHENRHFILQIALKCADISNPCRPWDISYKWSQKVCEEFFRQGDYERQLNLPVTSLCDRHSTSIPKIQAGFFRFVVAPLLEEWDRFLCTTLSNKMIKNLRDNQTRWETALQQELAEETRTEISEAEEICDEISDARGSDDESRRSSLPTVVLETVDRLGRRHSVPLSLSHPNAPPPVWGNTLTTGDNLRLRDERSRRFTIGQISNLKEEEEELQLSQMSSCSNQSFQRSSDCGSNDERPVSAENLLPELSIASITTHDEASRLSSVLHGNVSLAPPPSSRSLQRQQTFPPLQPYVRTRYMSTSGEPIAHSTSISSSSSSRTGGSDSDCAGLKRDSTDDSDREKITKFAKICEKENVNPRKDSLDVRRLAIPQNTRRRGSAPVGQLSAELIERLARRGSMPTSDSRQSVLKPLGLKENAGMPRRSSLPFDLHHSATLFTDASNGEDLRHREKGSKKSKKKKLLRRRSSGGPDLLLPREHLLNRRRGSLPSEMFTSQSGNSNNRNLENSRRIVSSRRSLAHPKIQLLPQ